MNSETFRKNIKQILIPEADLQAKIALRETDLLPASVLQLPRCLVRICNLFLTNHKIANLTVSKNAIAAGKTDCKIEFASQTWATRPHLGSIFVKLLHRKTFQLPAARCLQS